LTGLLSDDLGDKSAATSTLTQTHTSPGESFYRLRSSSSGLDGPPNFSFGYFFAAANNYLIIGHG
jgi:hypothetical protein